MVQQWYMALWNMILVPRQLPLNCNNLNRSNPLGFASPPIFFSNLAYDETLLRGWYECIRIAGHFIEAMQYIKSQSEEAIELDSIIDLHHCEHRIPRIMWLWKNLRNPTIPLPHVASGSVGYRAKSVLEAILGIRSHLEKSQDWKCHL